MAFGVADPGYRWRDGHPQRRAAWAKRLRDEGPVQCGCVGQCHHHTGPCEAWLHDGDTWVLGHNGAGVTAGDDGHDSSPWCVPCNGRDAAHKTNNPANASRDWWSL